VDAVWSKLVSVRNSLVSGNCAGNCVFEPLAQPRLALKIQEVNEEQSVLRREF